MAFDFGKLIVDGENYGNIAIVRNNRGSIDYIETFPTNKLGKKRLTMGEIELLGEDIELSINVR